MNGQIHERQAHDKVEAVRVAWAVNDTCKRTGARVRTGSTLKQASDLNALTRHHGHRPVRWTGVRNNSSPTIELWIL